MQKRTELSYRLATIDSSNPFGLMIALYDTLIGDLQRSAEAIRRNDIEARCDKVNHAYAILGQLESWIDPESDPPLAKSLKDFYAHLRSRIFTAGVRQSAPTLEALIVLLLQVRTTWQQRESSYRSAPSNAA